MGTDISMYAERKVGDKWKKLGHLSFDYRSYNLFTWLGCQMRDVPVGPLANREWPEDSPYYVPPRPPVWGEWPEGGYAHSWFTVRELMSIDIPEEYRWFAEEVLVDKLLAGCDPDSTRILISFDC